MNKWDSEQFQSPANRYRPKLRWWLPGAFMDNEEIKREIEWMAGNGYGGARSSSNFFRSRQRTWTLRNLSDTGSAAKNGTIG